MQTDAILYAENKLQKLFTKIVFLASEGAEKWELSENFAKNCVQGPLFGAAEAENFKKFWYFSEKSPKFEV